MAAIQWHGDGDGGGQNAGENPWEMRKKTWILMGKLWILMGKPWIMMGKPWIMMGKKKVWENHPNRMDDSG